MKAGRGLTVERMMELGRASRASFYRFDESSHPGHEADMDLRDAIQRIALEWPSYGRPRITAELRRRRWKVNPKRVYRILREDNLLCIRKRKFVVTTDSKHGRKVYPNLARTMVLTGMDQLWLADITYIRLREEFVFLAVILDAFSRRVIGWALDRTLEDQLTLAALKMALSRRSVQPGLVHHSDRGSQYASGDYTNLLKESGIGREHVAQRQPVGQRGLRIVYENAEVRRGVSQRIPGSAGSASLDSRVPGENLQRKTASLRARLCAANGVRSQSRGTTKGGRYAAAFYMSFLGIGKSIHPMRTPAGPASPPHRSDEFPAGYSLAGCAPALPASASLTASEYALKSSCRSIVFHRTVNSVLTVCLTPGGRPISLLIPARPHPYCTTSLAFMFG
jgi:putative transposase